jgi:UDP-N-acetylmuramoyl-L-alanyl-D-glutamate--2,6-diaminopimelate ligase
MRFGQIIANAAQIVRGSPETEITGITCDSRRVSAGMLFCALAGVKANGSTFIQDALARGAAAVLAEREVPGDFPLAVAKEARRATALAASSFYRWPAAQLVMLSVTGTNGKTTVAYLTEEMVRTAGRRAGLIGTVEERFPGVSRPSSYTTPESIDLQALLAEMVAAKTEIVAMEVSSHALAQARVDGIRFRAAGFTQLTRDHLDYHGTMDNYFEAKALLFRHHLAQEGTAVIGTEDDWSDRLAASIASRRPWRYGIGRSADTSGDPARDFTAGGSSQRAQCALCDRSRARGEHSARCDRREPGDDPRRTRPAGAGGRPCRAEGVR